MPATHTIELHFPLPAYLSRDRVIQHLQTYEPLITPHPYLQRHDRRPVDLKDIVDDPFFTEAGWQIESYVIVERVPIVPLLGLAKDIRIPATFQSFPAGVRCRADAQGGVTVWSTYEVARRDLGAEFERAGRAGSDGVGHDGWDHDVLDAAGMSSPGGATAGGEWELVERAKVECSALVKPFVVRSFEAAHRDLCRKVIEGLKAQAGTEYPAPTGQAPVVVPVAGVVA